MASSAPDDHLVTGARFNRKSHFKFGASGAGSRVCAASTGLHFNYHQAEPTGNSTRMTSDHKTLRKFFAERSFRQLRCTAIDACGVGEHVAIRGLAVYCTVSQRVGRVIVAVAIAAVCDVDVGHR